MFTVETSISGTYDIRIEARDIIDKVEHSMTVSIERLPHEPPEDMGTRVEAARKVLAWSCNFGEKNHGADR